MTRQKLIAYGKDYLKDLISAACEISEIHKEFVKESIEALQIIELFEKPLIITGGRLNGRTNAYKCGLNDAWGCAKKIVSSDGLDMNELVEIFGDYFFDDIFENNSAFEAIRKILEYENRQNQLEEKSKTQISKGELYRLFCNMSETMQIAIVEIMKVTQEKESED